jgi:hypothetical protein
MKGSAQRVDAQTGAKSQVVVGQKLNQNDLLITQSDTVVDVWPQSQGGGEVFVGKDSAVVFLDVEQQTNPKLLWVVPPPPTLNPPLKCDENGCTYENGHTISLVFEPNLTLLGLGLLVWPSPEPVHLRLALMVLRGAVHVVLDHGQPPPGKDEWRIDFVISYTAAAGRKGTEFTVSVAEDGSTTIATFDGTVVAADWRSNTNDTASVDANHQLTVSEGEVLNGAALQGRITAFDPKSIERWWVLPVPIPTLLSPANTYQPAINPSSVTFTWSNNGSSGLIFAVYVDRWDYGSNSWVSYYVPSSYVQGTSLTLTNLPSGSYYAWIVVAVDPTQQSNPWYAWSSWYVFSTT